MVSSFSGVWLYENHGTPDDYDTSRTYPLLTGLHLGLAFALTIMGPGEVLGVLPLLVAALHSPLYHLLSTHGGAVYDQKHIYPPHRAAADAEMRVLFIYEHYRPGYLAWHGMMDCLHRHAA